MTLDLELARNFAIALFIGALIGIEREKKKETEHASIGGIRTFLLFAELGAVCGWMAQANSAPLILAVGLLAMTVIITAGYLEQRKAEGAGYGLTTEAAALVTYVLGAAALYGQPEVAVALAIVTSSLLAMKAPMHEWVERVGADDLIAGLKLLFASLIVLPLLPNEPVDPWGVLNPWKLWWLVILISGLSLAGYIAVRWLGEHRGLALTGLFGGLVSSTAVTMSFARRSKGAAAPTVDAIASGILLAWTVMFARVLVEVAVVHRPLLSRLVVPMAVMGGVGLAAAVVFYRRGATSGAAVKTDDGGTVKNPFNLTSAIKFGAFFALILVLVRRAQTHLPGGGVYLVALLAGTTDVDAITLSMAEAAKNGGDVEVSVRAIVIAVLSNTVVKCGLAVSLGSAALRTRVLIATGAVLVAGGAAILLQ